MEKLMTFFKKEDGATAVEYGIMIALIAVVIIGLVRGIGLSLNDVFDEVDTQLQSGLDVNSEPFFTVVV